MMSKQKVFFKTFGCRTNLYDTQVMRENLSDFECTQSEQEAQIVVVNSCTVTNGADSGVRNYIRKAHNDGKRVIFAGCGVKTQGRALFENHLVSGVLGHSHKENLNRALLLNERFFYEDRLEERHLDSTIISEFVGKSRAFIKIQEGCDFACSYCIIPSVRGAARSYDMRQIIKQVEILVEKGVLEIVLTGTNVGSYGRDKKSSITALLRELFRIKQLKRIRIGSLEPSQIDEEFFTLLGHEKLEKHLHIALQYTQNEILAKMNRINRVESDFLLLERIAKLGYAIGTDFIVGHPGESEQIWQEALENAKYLPLTHIHPFVYSVRDGTPSALMSPKVRGDEAKQRLHALSECIKAKNLAFRQAHKSQNKPLWILLEKQIGDCYYGLDEFFNKIVIESNARLPQWFCLEKYEVQEDMNYAKI